MSHYQSNRLMRRLFRLRSFDICPSRYNGSGPVYQFYFLMLFGFIPIWWGRT